MLFLELLRFLQATFFFLVFAIALHFLGGVFFTADLRMADQRENKTATDNVARQRGACERKPEILPAQLTREYKIGYFGRTHHDVRKVAERHQVSDKHNDRYLGVFHRRDHPDHGRNHPARHNALGKHLAQVVFHDLVANFQKRLVGAGIENRQVEHDVGHRQRADQIAGQNHTPQAQQPPDVGQVQLAHDRQYSRDGVFREQLLARQDYRQKPCRIAEAADHMTTGDAFEARVQQTHRHQRQAHGQPRSQCRPPQRGYAALQFVVALHANGFVQHCRAGRLILIDLALFLGGKAGGLAIYFVIHTTSSAPVMKWPDRGNVGPMVQTGAARCRSPAAGRIEKCLSQSAECVGLAQQIGALHAFDTHAEHGLPGLLQRAVHVDGATGIFDHKSIETGTACILRRPGDTEVQRQTDHEQRIDTALCQVPGQPCTGRAVCLQKCRVTVDVRIAALTQDQLRVRQIEVGMQLSTVAALYAMIRPQRLRTVGQGNALERQALRMAGSKGNVPGRVPVLRDDHLGKARTQAIDQRQQRIAVSHSQLPAGHEVVLHVDHQQGATRIGRLVGKGHRGFSGNEQ
ncbi:hypothetical protein ALQ56_05740 [Pseudomonas syringae pv. papulans]|nr:hypothetical protein ALQ56_05740 [Pseudomonas syringae pv. papulans]